MTCHDALTLLEEYIDRELPTEKEALVKQHFDSCTGCREELDSMLLLKELLKSHKVPDPGDAYWAETTKIIKARTIEADGEVSVTTTITDIRSMQRNALLRSVVSVAASLVILFSALLVGSGQKERLANIEASKPPVYYAASINEVVGDDNTVYVSRDEQSKMTQGMLLLGAPGFLGRFGGAINAAAVSN